MSKVPEQPARFFEEAKACLAHLRGIPVVAIEALQTDESTRGVIVSIVNVCFDICHDAGLDIADELKKQLIRDHAQNSLKELMRDDRLITMEELKAKGLKLRMTENGPIVVPA